MAEMIVYFAIRLFAQKCFICVDCISCEKGLFGFWNVFFDVLEQLRGGLFSRRFRCEDCFCETILSMGLGTPFVLRSSISQFYGLREEKFVPSYPLSPSTDGLLLPIRFRPVYPSSHL
jgi:hypothetical protein